MWRLFYVQLDYRENDRVSRRKWAAVCVCVYGYSCPRRRVEPVLFVLLCCYSLFLFLLHISIVRWSIKWSILRFRHFCCTTTTTRLGLILPLTNSCTPVHSISIVVFIVVVVIIISTHSLSSVNLSVSTSNLSVSGVSIDIRYLTLLLNFHWQLLTQSTIWISFCCVVVLFLILLSLNPSLVPIRFVRHLFLLLL